MPHTFQDRIGREWTIDLTIGTMERLKAKTDFDLYEPGLPVRNRLLDGVVADKQPALQERLAGDWSLFWELLFLILEPDLQAANVTAEAFGKVMASACLVQAKRAFWEEWSDFFQSLESEAEVTTLAMQRKVTEAQARVVATKAKDPRLAQTLSRLEKAAEQEAEKILMKALEEVDQAIAEAKTESPASANSSGAMPEQSASVPASSSA